MKKYVVYKITNLLNQKFYIGVHLTDDPNDSYFGSGVALHKAVALHGKQFFQKEILFENLDKTTAYALEKELLTDHWDKNYTYNMRAGGIGGFTKENAAKGYEASKSKLKASLANRKKGSLTTEQRSSIAKKAWQNRKLNSTVHIPRVQSEETKNKISKSLIGSTHTKETKQKMSKTRLGMLWINNGVRNTRIRPNVVIPEGWVKGFIFLS